MKAILAVSSNLCIGKDGKLPWHIPEELKLFKKITLKYKNVIMGKTTYDTLPILRGRNPIVLSTSISYLHNAKVYNSVTEIVNKYPNGIIIGGAKTIKAFLPFIKTFHVSHILKYYKGDTYINKDIFKQFTCKYQTKHKTKVADFMHYILRNKNAY